MADIETEIGKLPKDKVESNEGDPLTVPLQEPTTEQILQAAELLQSKENNGGYRKIADTVGVKLPIVKRIHQAMKARLAAIVASEEVK